MAEYPAASQSDSQTSKDRSKVTGWQHAAALTWTCMQVIMHLDAHLLAFQLLEFVRCAGRTNQCDNSTAAHPQAKTVLASAEGARMRGNSALDNVTNVTNGLAKMTLTGAAASKQGVLRNTYNLLPEAASTQAIDKIYQANESDGPMAAHSCSNETAQHERAHSLAQLTFAKSSAQAEQASSPELWPQPSSTQQEVVSTQAMSEQMASGPGLQGVVAQDAAAARLDNMRAYIKMQDMVLKNARGELSCIKECANIYTTHRLRVHLRGALADLVALIKEHEQCLRHGEPTRSQHSVRYFLATVLTPH